ncbi:5-methylcytosine rRNA methyltransferase NSUN4 [Leptopilina heterotoma]|uniref:5-methylcytosine rRNA methyltransferase NSUN4 n=1 Tax=Leptopilina heterotoma TaxID=63436 RepID=UPI001CA8EB19|nr:5-methylcytosine rRNA methyltransferase NSUN4 [Leptopilina heterotoma]
MHSLRRLRSIEILPISVRFKGHSNDHWSKRDNKLGTVRALKHFDDFYKTVYGKSWNDIRKALLQEKSKYVAVVNNFSDNERICTEMECLGAIDLRAIIKVQKEILDESDKGKSKKRLKELNRKKMQREMDSFISQQQLSELESVYPAETPAGKQSLNELIDEEKFHTTEEEGLKPVSLKSISANAEIEYDTSRIISASSSLSVSSLQEFVPVTKLKGLDDWVLESEHYGYYSKGEDFTISIEEDDSFSIPEQLKLYTFEPHNFSRFRSSKRGTTGVLDYYLMDGGSILPVLALDLQLNDKFLDICAAPGGKSLVAIETLLPAMAVLNDVLPSRVTRIKEVIGTYVSNIGQWQKKIAVTTKDAREIDDMGLFNKILVDVPCTNDRHSLHVNDGNWFRNEYIRERLKLPELQSEILVNALKLVAPGGTVVYSTCSLSPIQNEGVVQMSLMKAFEEANVVAVVKDLSEGLKPFKYLYDFGKEKLKYGHLVIPTMGNNWGPMYFCKIMRIQ